MELDVDLDLEDETTDEVDEAEEAEEKPKLTPEQRRGMLQRELTKLNKELGVVPEKKEVKTKTTEPDYAKIAYLNSVGNTHPDDQQWVIEEASRLKLPLTDVLKMEHAKMALKNAKDQREALAGMPKGGRRGGNNIQQDVDYHLAKGTTPDDLALAKKVIDARVNKEKNQNIFSDELYTG